MTPGEIFPSERLEGAPSDDIGWHFGTLVPGTRNNIVCKLCGKVVKGGITCLKQHIAHKKGDVASCPRVTSFIRENMMKILQDSSAKKKDSKKRKEEFEARLRGKDDYDDDDNDNNIIDKQRSIREAMRESMRTHQEWENR